MNISIDTGLMTATLQGDANGNPIPIKAGSPEPVTITCTANGVASLTGNNIAMSLGLTSTVGTNPQTLAWLDTFISSGGVYVGTLNCNDLRLMTFFANLGSAPLNIEVQWSIGGGEPFIAPNMIVPCEQQQTGANPGGAGGPNYVTTAELAAALAAILDANGNILIGTHARLAPTATGCILQTSASGLWNDTQNSQQWP